MARPEWEVEITDEGLYDVLNFGRPARYDLDDLDDAVREIRRRGGSEYILIEPDGYRTTHRV